LYTDTHAHSFPEDIVTDVEQTEKKTTFTNFRDYYTDICAGYMGSRELTLDPVFSDASLYADCADSGVGIDDTFDPSLDLTGP